MEANLIDKFKQAEESFNHAKKQLEELTISLEAEQTRMQENLESMIQSTMLSQFDETKIKSFFEEPYVIIPRKSDEWYVIAPKFINFQIGWLEKSTNSYNVFVVNKFINWIAQVPPEISKMFKFKPVLPLKVFDGMVLTGEDHQEETWNRYHDFLTRREGSDKIRIKPGREFQLIAKMIDDGILPFIRQPLDPNDFIKRDKTLPSWLQTISDRTYFTQAFDTFSKSGAVGIFWPFATGKSLFGLYCCWKLKGPHLVVVPTLTLKEQWLERLKMLGLTNSEVVTYHAFDKVRNKSYTLAVFDEVHHLPANTFSRLATVNSKYRIGLSATPYREDGRTDYIFALSGFPIGIDWSSLIQLGIVKIPEIRLYLMKDRNMKIMKLEELLLEEKKTIIFCDGIDLGKSISKKFEIPHVFGETKDRLEIINNSVTTVVSRVGDEGLSLPKLERVIEVDFLKGSRRQEGQRLGRTFHSEEPGEHIIMMTDEEFELHEKRLYSIYEKGFKINVIRG
jgi:DNA excision repair protein ERCC-3